LGPELLAACFSGLVLSALPDGSARAQGVVESWGADTGTEHLSPGQFGPMPLDANGNLVVSVPNGVTLAAPATVNQGAPAGAGQAWPVSDANSAAFQNIVPVTAGTPFGAGRSIGYVCTGQGTVTFTFAGGGTHTQVLSVSPFDQMLPYAVTNIAVGTATGCSFWNMT
jgi:hypothetical protein